MGKITIIDHVSPEGIIQAPGGLEKNPAALTADGLGSMPTPKGGAAIMAGHAEPSFCCQAAESTIAGATFGLKHRRVLDEVPTESLGSDIIAGVRRLKATDGPQLILWGSPALTPVLLEHELADEILLLVHPFC